jgi:ABC-type glycerol-3-phosphate transport system permease component
LIPLYLLYNKLGWQDTYLPLTVPFFFGGAPFYIFLLRQFFRTIPNELDEAALIDGCSRLGILYRIILPLSKPALATVAIFSFMAHWNEFLMPLIYIDSQEKLTVALGLSRFTGMYGATLWNLLMAASLVTVLPCILVFLFAQKYFVRGIVTTGLAGR